MAKITDILSGKNLGQSKNAAPTPRVTLNIDYPQAGETVNRGHYAVRISSAGAQCEASIDDGQWQPCRRDENHSWFDWMPDKAGSHKISVRAQANGKWVRVDRNCRVK